MKQLLWILSNLLNYEWILLFSNMSRNFSSGTTSIRRPSHAIPTDFTTYHLVLFIEPPCILPTIFHGNWLFLHITPLLHMVTHALISLLDGRWLWTGDHSFHYQGQAEHSRCPKMKTWNEYSNAIGGFWNMSNCWPLH